MKSPVFPRDFKILYTEGASYWWWSPFTGQDWDGTMPVGEDFPEGVMLGCEDTTDAQLCPGDSIIIQWMNAECSPVDSQTIGSWNGEDSTVQLAVDLLLTCLVEDGYLVNLGDAYSRPS